MYVIISLKTPNSNPIIQNSQLKTLNSQLKTPNSPKLSIVLIWTQADYLCLPLTMRLT